MNSLQEQRSNAVSWSKRMEVVARYMLLGNMRLVSEQMNISYNTLMAWKNSDWWPEVVEQLKRQKQQKTNENIVRLIEQSLEVMQDRLDNGDFVFDQKTGEIKRKPVGVREATTIATSLLQRQQAQEELDQRMSTKTQTVQETLSMIASELKKHNRITGPVEDARIIDYADKRTLEQDVSRGENQIPTRNESTPEEES